MKQREYGLDVARIISMLGILVLHILGRGGLLLSYEPTSVRYWVYWAVEIIAYASVDLFAMLTGWLDVNRTSKPSTFRVFELLTVTISYSVLLTLLFSFFLPQKVIGLKSVLKGFFPMVVGRYWYITCYIPVAIIKPYLSGMLSEMPNEKLKKLCMILVVVFSVIPTFTMTDLFAMNWGYSTMWLFICYIVGFYLKRMNDTIEVSSCKLVGCYIAITILLFAIKVLLQVLTGVTGRFVEYTSPFVLASAAIALLLFSRIKVQSGRKQILFLSNVAFDVYIIHYHIFVFDYIINSNFLWIDKYPIITIPFIILGIAIICFCVLALIGGIRSYIFTKMRIEKVLKAVARKIDKIVY